MKSRPWTVEQRLQLGAADILLLWWYSTSQMSGSEQQPATGRWS